MKTIGLSIYPEHAATEDIIAYIDKAHALGFSRIFTCMISFTGGKEALEASFGTWMRHASALGFEIIADVSPEVFSGLGMTLGDLSPFAELGLSGIRLDMGFSGHEEALMSYDASGIRIELNMSNGTKYIDNILSYQPNKERLMGCHNFYPHRYTGLSRAHFMKTSEQFKSLGLRTAAFVNAPSAAYGPWEVTEGLCSLEMHRMLPIETQAKDLLNTGLIDDVIIANMFASDDELKALSEVDRHVLTLQIEQQVELTTEEMLILTKEPHFNRGDVSEYVVRSTQSRVKYKGTPFEPKNTRDMEEGDIIIESSLYTRYAGELHIALNAMENSGKSSVVAKVVPHERYLIHEIKPWQTFAFRLKK